MSVTFAPRARIAVNASWPGVSRNVIFRPSTLGLVRADVLRDAAGLGLDDGRRADRVEQRRLAVVDVAHDRDDRRARRRGLPRRPRRSRGSSSSAACLIVTSRSTSEAISSTSSSESDCVAVRIWPRPIRILMICDIGTPSAADRSLTVTPDSTVTGPVGCAGACGRAGACCGAVARSARVAAACRAALDHDAPAPAPLAAAARADRTVRSVRAVSHQTVQCRCARAQGSTVTFGTQRPRERAARDAPARSTRAGRQVYAPRPGSVPSRRQHAVHRREAPKLGLRRTAAAADARPDGDATLTPRRSSPLPAPQRPPRRPPRSRPRRCPRRPLRRPPPRPR